MLPLIRRRSKVLNRTRSYAGLPAFASSNASTVSRFNRYDERSKPPSWRERLGEFFQLHSKNSQHDYAFRPSS